MFLDFASVDRNQEYIKAFGEHLRSLRQKAGLTQEQLAEATGMDFTQIGRFERGVRGPSLTSVKKLADGLSVNPKELFDF